jgi:hypothetical protein
MHHHRHALTVARTLIPVTERRRSCGKRWYEDRIAADLALARIRAWGRAMRKDPGPLVPLPRVRRLAPHVGPGTVGCPAADPPTTLGVGSPSVAAGGRVMGLEMTSIASGPTT